MKNKKVRVSSCDDKGGDKAAEKLYEPEKILEARKDKHGWFYRIKWVGYKESESTWVSKRFLSHNTAFIRLGVEQEHMSLRVFV